MAIEITLLQLVSQDELLSLADLFRRLEDLERRAGSMRSEEPMTIKKKQNPEIAEEPKEEPLREFSINDVEGVWPTLIERVKAKKISAGMFLSEAEPVEVEGTVVTLGLPVEFKLHQEFLERRENKTLVETTLRELISSRCAVRFVAMELERTQVPVSVPAEEEKVPEIVEAALKIFNGKIVSKSPSETQSSSF
jgi:hypothetical protein